MTTRRPLVLLNGDVAELPQSDTLTSSLRRVGSITASSTGGAVTCDWSLYDEIRVLMDTNVALTFTGGTNGQGCTLRLKQDSTGGHTVAMATAVRFSADITGYTPTATANKFDRLGFIHDAADGRYDFVAVVKGF